MLWKVTYFIEKVGQRRPRTHTTEVRAKSYTEAYLKFTFENPKDYAIKDLVAISA